MDAEMKRHAAQHPAEHAAAHKAAFAAFDAARDAAHETRITCEDAENAAYAAWLVAYDASAVVTSVAADARDGYATDDYVRRFRDAADDAMRVAIEADATLVAARDAHRVAMNTLRATHNVYDAYV